MSTRGQQGTFKIKHPGLISEFAASPLVHSLLTTIEPKGFKSASKFPEWVHAMDEEIQALRDNTTWELVPRDAHMNVVGAK